MTDHLLHYGKASPFARKVRIAIREKALLDRVDEKLTNWRDNDPEFVAANPLGKVPTLERPDGPPLFESDVICDYLDSIGSGPRLYPHDAEPRLAAQRWQALADGIHDATVFVTLNSRFFDGNIDPRWLDRQRNAIRRTLATLENDAETLRRHGQSADIDIGLIALATLPLFLDLCNPLGEPWRPFAERFAAWVDGYAESRESFTETALAKD